ncbi:MAG: hypothetical protein ACSLEL_04365 [Candidatus Malihini olakiniferum]
MIKTRQDLLNVYTNVNHQKIYRTKQLVSKIYNIPIPATKQLSVLTLHRLCYNLDMLYADFLQLTGKKDQVFDYDLEALAFIYQQLARRCEYYHLDSFNV